MVEGGNTKVVVLGGGFGGLSAVSELRRRSESLEIVLVEKNPFSLFTPGLEEYLVDEVDREGIVLDLEEVMKKKSISFVEGEAESVDVGERRVHVELEEGGVERVRYDYLVVAVGSEVNEYGIKGAENACRFKSLEDAEDVKKALGSGEELKVGVIGGGLVGVEVASWIREKYSCEEIQIRLFNPGSSLLSNMDERIGKKVEDYLFREEVRIHRGSRVCKVKENSLVMEDGAEFQSDITIMATGFKRREKIENFDLEYDKRGVLVDKYLRTSDSRVYALGDCIGFRDEELSRGFVKRAQIAQKQGVLVAKNIISSLRGKEEQRWFSKDIPTVISLGKRPVMCYKGFSFQSRLVSFIEKLIWQRQMLKYSGRGLIYWFFKKIRW